MTSNTQRAAYVRGRVRDYILYVLIGFAFLGMVFVIEGEWGHDAFIRWGGLIGFTSGLFGYFVSESRQYFRELSFWTLTALLLCVHLAVFAVVLTHVDEWKLTWFIGMVLEFPVMIFFRNRLRDSV